MKKFTSFLFILSLVCTIYPGISQAQVTMNQSDYARKAGFTDSFSTTTQSGIAAPGVGAAQVWDYTSLTASGTGSRDYVDATSDANFSGALNYYDVPLTFQGLPIPNKNYEAVDANGWYEMGRSLSAISHSITSISGGANDSLVFIADNEIYDGRIDLVKFPMTYQSAWTQSYTAYNNFELTVNAFFLNKTPGYLKRKLTDKREVVGYGKLSIPKSDGSASADMDVLMMKVVRFALDSYYLNSMPAPAPILGAFGLTQGATASDSFYIYYMPGFPAPVLSLNMSSTGSIESAVYRSQAADVVTGINELEAPALYTYPNPVKAGQSVKVNLANGNEKISRVSICDIQGRTIISGSPGALKGNQFELSIPAGTSKGLYILQVQGQNSGLLSKQKLIIE